MMTVVLSLTLVSDDYTPQRAGHASCPGPDPQHLWWQSFCSCRSRAMEQFTATSQRCWITVQSVLAVTKDIFGWIVGHGAVWTILTAPSRNNLTYFLYDNITLWAATAPSRRSYSATNWPCPTYTHHALHSYTTTMSLNTGIAPNSASLP